MATVQVTSDNFQGTIQKGIVLLDFWASWCGPCRVFGPVFEEAASRHPQVVFGKVDVEAESSLAEALQISAIPTLMALRDGVLLAARPGALSPTALDEFIGKVQALDMTEVRRLIEGQEPTD